MMDDAWKAIGIGVALLTTILGWMWRAIQNRINHVYDSTNRRIDTLEKEIRVGFNEGRESRKMIHDKIDEKIESSRKETKDDLSALKADLLRAINGGRR